MKAIVITRPGDPEVLEMGERPMPEPGRSEVLVRVRASALNRADLLQRRGKYPPPPGFPEDVPGLEYAGDVEAVGESVRRWRAGDRVMGIVGGGGHSEYVRVHEREAIAVPGNLSWTEAGAIPEAFLTAFDALRQVDVRMGERVLVHAVTSGVGTAAVQLARLTGAVTFGTSRTAAKLERVRSIGLEHAVNSSEEGWTDALEAVVGDRGIDAVIDLVGGSYQRVNLSLLASRGRIITVGTMGGSRVEVDLRILMRKRARLLGTVLRARPVEEKISLAQEFGTAVLPHLASGRLRPVIDSVHSFEHVVEAHRRMEENRNVGKIVLLW